MKRILHTKDEIQIPMSETPVSDKTAECLCKKDSFLPISIILAACIIAGAWIYAERFGTVRDSVAKPPLAAKAVGGGEQQTGLEEKVLPAEGFVLPVRWGDLGVQMIQAGVIDKGKIESLYTERGGLSGEERALLEEGKRDKLTITQSNASFLLNLFWALGLGTKNAVLDNGPMRDSKYGGAENFASTGGWSLATGANVMDHYSTHPFIVLTPAQQERVERVSKGIYRPCCGNSTYFPDCNHGMAMLGLLELMASQGVSEKDMYKTALQVNAYWFPDTYITIAQYLSTQGSDWTKADPREILGEKYSSSAGYSQIRAQTAPSTGGKKGGGGCGV